MALDPGQGWSRRFSGRLLEDAEGEASQAPTSALPERSYQA
jgi:hypothetical protein